MVRLRTCLRGILLPVPLLLAAGPGMAETLLQTPPQVPSQTSPQASDGPPGEADTAPAPRKRPPVPKPKPKPKPVQAKPAPETAPAAPAAGAEPAPTMPAANLPGLTVLCEAKAALYEGPRDFTVWVTRTGVIVLENPLRPLTPETTRVLQVVIAGKAATAYGRDLFALRRGGSQGALEGMLGAPVRWDTVPVALPDTLNIVSETGQSLAQLGFRECGEAPVVKTAPVAAKDKPKARDPAKKARAKATTSPDGGGKAPPGLSLPQGAIE